MKLILLIFSFGFFSAFFAQEKVCSAIKTGTFYAKAKKKSTPILKIERTDSTQTETILATNEKTYYKINWLNECQFVLNPIQASTDTIRRTVVSILKVKKDFYKFKVTMLYQPVIYGKIYRKEEY
jgi:hypothetical protein